jgi:hypothetical protein
VLYFYPPEFGVCLVSLAHRCNSIMQDGNLQIATAGDAGGA